MTDHELTRRITAYLTGGGLFNPEMANHERVRDLLIDCRDALAQPEQDHGFDRTASHMAGEYVDTAQPEQEPVKHAVIAGVLFDFMGWLTSRQIRLVLSASDDASPFVKVIEEFAKMRGLSLDSAKVKDWQDALAQPKSHPVAKHVCNLWINPKTFFYEVDRGTHPINEVIPVYTAPPKREWVGLTSEDWENTPDTGKQGCERDVEIFDWIEQTLKDKNT